MHIAHRTRLHLISLTGAVVAVVCGTWTGTRLAGYGVPWPLYMACAMAVSSALLSSLDRVTQRLDSTLYRCREVDCAYKVRVAHVDAAERRRWQEAAASHPCHELNARP
ncbi:hypothetical protein [Streptomyces sp. NBC_00212]|uniref:hypothetical protein n=1 Tax=Streptomyces sp. NBC_00212 TaxID=2975684 RepID=UPI003246183B